MGVNLREFRRTINRLKRKIERSIPRALSASGEQTVETIVDRTQRGQGLNGAFPRYSQQYRDYRQENGRGATPDLNFSGRMLSNLGVERKNNNAVKVGFSRNEEKNKARQNQKKRPFVGIKRSEESIIVRAFTRQFERDIR